MPVAIRHQNIFGKLSHTDPFEVVNHIHCLCFCYKTPSAAPCLNKGKGEGSFHTAETESSSNSETGSGSKSGVQNVVSKGHNYATDITTKPLLTVDRAIVLSE